MPKRLLFVDDEPMLLDGLRRALHGMRSEWKMEFVGSGEAALIALAQVPYDAIVTDMRMPKMDGAKLLEQTKQLHPEVIRLVLSGESSRASVLRSIAPAHQILSKPCDPEELIARLAQAFAMRDLLSNQSLKTIVSRLQNIPSLPIIYDELMAALRLDDPSLAQIGRIIAKDVGMAAKILQLANSAFIGARSQISNLLQAVSLIGTESVRTLVLSVNVFSQLDGKSEAAPYLPSLWEHSIATASLARQIAQFENCPKVMIEESFTAGLLHDIGKAVLLAEMPHEYRQILEPNPPGSIAAMKLERLELEQIGCTHGQLGAYLISVWGLPVPLVRAVAFHHCPMEAAETQFSSLTAVHAADAIAMAAASAPPCDCELDMDYLERIGLCARAADWCNLPEAKRPTVPDPNPVN